MFIRSLPHLLSLLFAFALISCGGGGGSSKEPSGTGGSVTPPVSSPSNVSSVGSVSSTASVPSISSASSLSYSRGAVSSSSQNSSGISVGMQPKVFWVSQPVNHDETLLITGGNLMPEETEVELIQLTDEAAGSPASSSLGGSGWSRLPTHTSTERSLTATVPANWTDGVYGLRLKNGDQGIGETVLVNAPDPWFVQGDMGDAATPGGYFVVAGTALERKGGLAPRAVLLDLTGGMVAELGLAERITNSTGYALRFAVPASVSEGEYQLWLHNGRGGEKSWVRFSTFIDAPLDTVIVKKAKVWPTTVFNVSSYNGTDDEKFAAAIAAADANGGGKIYVPAGTYTLTKPLVLPAYTLLAGAGRDVSLIQWANGMSKTLVSGKETNPSPYKRGAFAIEDLTLQTGSDFRNRVIERSYTTDYSWIRRAAIKAPQFVSEALWDNAPTALYLEESRNLVLDDVVIDAHNCVLGRVLVSYLRVQNSKMTWFGRHFGIAARSHNVLLTNNALTQRAGTGDPTGLNLTTFHGDPDFGGPFSRDFLLARNTSTREATSIPIKRSQGYTSDGSNGIYVGKIAAVSGTTLTLAGKTANPLRPVGVPVTYSWAGAIAQIVEGRGAGQWRYISQATAGVSSVTIDRAWDIQPDATSTLAIVNLQGRQLMVDNDFGAEPQFDDFYMTLDSIRAGNKFGTTGSSESTVTAWSGNVYTPTATFAAWHYQVLDNRTVRGTNMGYISMSLDLDDNLYHFPYHGVAGASHVYRNNQNTAAGAMWLSVQSKGHEFADLVIEKNQFDQISFDNTNTSFPISLSGVLIRQNNKTTGAPSVILPSGSLDFQAPGAPSSFVGIAAQTTLSLSWSAASDDIGVVAYQLKRDGNVIASLGGTVLSFTNTGLIAGTRYTYTLRAIDASGKASAPIVLELSTLAQGNSSSSSSSSLSSSSLSSSSSSSSSGGSTTFKDPGTAMYRKADNAPGYYVNSVTGNDTADGKSPATAWKTLTKLNSVDLNPGDVVHLARGSVWENEGIFLFPKKRAGTASQPIVFQAYGTGDRPTISRPKNYFHKTQEFSGFYLGNGSAYITVLDVRIQDAPSGPAILMTSNTHHIVIAGVEVLRSGAGIGVSGENQTIVSNYVHDGVMALDTGDGSRDWGANGITVYGKNIEIAYNRLVNCVAPSKAFGEDGGAFEFFSYQPVEEGSLGYNYVSDNISIHHNFVDHAKGFMEAAGKVTNLKIAYNLYINSENTAMVLHVNNVVKDGYMQMRIENNTFYSADANPWGYGLLIQYLKSGATEAEKALSKIVLRNNIWATNSSIDKWTNPLGSNVTHENNLYYFYGGGKFHNDNWKLNASEKLAVAKFVNPAAKDFRLQAGSPAIDASDGSVPLYKYDLGGESTATGLRADIGAYEWR